VEKLAEKRRELLQRQGRDLCEGCMVCVMGDEYPLPASAADETVLVRNITQAVMRNLEGEVQRR